MTPQPESPSYVPRSYQAEGIKLMVSQACAGLLMDPGLGKTSVIYAAFKILKAAGYVQRALVICPLRPAFNVWPKQKDRWSDFQDLDVTVLHGPHRKRLLMEEHDLYVINPEGLPWLFEQDCSKLYDMLVVDESTKFKSSNTQRFKLLRKHVSRFKRRYILTGSPAPRGLMDLFGQIYILDEGASLGSYITHYRNRFFFPSGYGGYDWQLRPGADKEIAQAISPLCLRVEAAGNIELPELLRDDIYVQLPADAHAEYLRMEADLVAQVHGGQVVAANTAVASSKCRQISNGAVYDAGGVAEPLHDEKINALVDLLDQLQGQSALITYEFDFDRARIAAALNIPCISTGNARKDDATIERFRRGEIPYVMGQPQSISLGIDGLQEACHHLIMFGVTWRLQDYTQVIDRVRRVGNTSNRVILHRILARDTIDERVVKVLDDRAATQESFLRMLQDMV